MPPDATQTNNHHTEPASHRPAATASARKLPRSLLIEAHSWRGCGFERGLFDVWLRLGFVTLVIDRESFINRAVVAAGMATRLQLATSLLERIANGSKAVGQNPNGGQNGGQS